MVKRKVRRHTAEQKSALLKQHLIDKVPVSELCEQAGIQPSLFYKWQRLLFENAATALETPKGPPSREKELEGRVEALEARLVRKDAIIADISEEHLKLKKELGEA